MLRSPDSTETSVSINLRFFFFFVKFTPESCQGLHFNEGIPAQENTGRFPGRGFIAYRFHQALHGGRFQHQGIEYIVSLLPHVQKHWKSRRRKKLMRSPHNPAAITGDCFLSHRPGTLMLSTLGPLSQWHPTQVRRHFPGQPAAGTVQDQRNDIWVPTDNWEPTPRRLFHTLFTCEFLTVHT